MRHTGLAQAEFSLKSRIEMPPKDGLQMLSEIIIQI